MLAYIENLVILVSLLAAGVAVSGLKHEVCGSTAEHTARVQGSS